MRSDGTLKDASEIVWYNDKDDNMPIVPSGTVQKGKFPFASLPPHTLKNHQHEIKEPGTLHGCRRSSEQSKKVMIRTRLHILAKVLAREKKCKRKREVLSNPEDKPYTSTLASSSDSEGDRSITEIAPDEVCFCPLNCHLY
jgi:hypothetical protein